MGSSKSWMVLVVVLAPVLVLPVLPLVVFVMLSQTCDQTADGVDAAVSVDLATVPKTLVAGYDHDQLVVAAHIMIEARRLGLSERDQQIGVMTAMGESSLGGDPTSKRPNDDGDVGVFQQRADVGWYADGATVEQNVQRLNDVGYAAKTFYSGHDVAVKGPKPAGAVGYHIPGLVDVAGRDLLEPSIAAHRVQGNSDSQHYAKWWDDAVEVVGALVGVKEATPASGNATDYNLGAVQPQTAQLANLLGPQFDIKTIGGVRPDSMSDHPSGLALDFMVYDDKAKGDRLAAYIVDHVQDLGVQYLIWYQRIWNTDRASEGWRSMSDRGSNTENHKDHVHVTMKKDTTRTGSSAAAGAECTLWSGDQSSDSPSQASSQGWVKPADGPLTSPFGSRTDPLTRQTQVHRGQDIAPACNAPIRAASSGTVSRAGPAESYGNLIIIDHGDEVQTAYAHMYADGVLVKVGDRVSAGEQIGKVGSAGRSTGCHLHFEVRLHGTRVDPVQYLASVGITL